MISKKRMTIYTLTEVCYSNAHIPHNLHTKHMNIIQYKLHQNSLKGTKSLRLSSHNKTFCLKNKLLMPFLNQQTINSQYYLNLSETVRLLRMPKTCCVGSWGLYVWTMRIFIGNRCLAAYISVIIGKLLIFLYD